VSAFARSAHFFSIRVETNLSRISCARVYYFDFVTKSEQEIDVNLPERRLSPSVLTPKLPLGDILCRDFTQNPTIEDRPSNS